MTNVSAVPGKRHIHIYWNATKDAGNGIIGHRILYNPKDKPTIEENWRILDVRGPILYNATIRYLIPNRGYEFKVYPQSRAMYGTPSKIVVRKTLMDGKSLAM